MKNNLVFNFVISSNGEEAEKKFLNAVQEKPNLTQEIARAFGSIMALACGWTEQDEVGITAFKIGKAQESPENAEKS